jgi:hypothetical protein
MRHQSLGAKHEEDSVVIYYKVVGHEDFQKQFMCEFLLLLRRPECRPTALLTG